MSARARNQQAKTATQIQYVPTKECLVDACSSASVILARCQDDNGNGHSSRHGKGHDTGQNQTISTLQHGRIMVLLLLMLRLASCVLQKIRRKRSRRNERIKRQLVWPSKINVRYDPTRIHTARTNNAPTSSFCGIAHWVFCLEDTVLQYEYACTHGPGKTSVILLVPSNHNDKNHWGTFLQY